MAITDPPVELYERLNRLSHLDYDTFSAQFANSIPVIEGIDDSSHVGVETSARSILAPVDIAEFPVIMAEIINREQDLKGILSPDRVELREEHSDLNVDGREAITWVVIQRRPGSFSQGKPGNATHQELSMHRVNEQQDPIYPGHNIIYYSQRMENLVQLTCWSSNSYSSNKRALWLEELIDTYKWYFTYKGIDRVFFKERTRDIVLETGGNPLRGTPLLYLVVTQKIREIRTATLKQLVLNIRGVSSPPLEK